MAYKSRAPRRKTEWGGIGGPSGSTTAGWTTLTAGSPTIISNGMVVSGSAGFVDQEVTLTRTIGMGAINLTDGTAGAQTYVQVGAIVAHQQAIAAGVSSLPSPQDNPESEWLYYAIVPVGNAQVTTSGGSGGPRYWEFDVRSQRVIKSGESIVWVAEAQNNDAAIKVAGRYLVKLP